MWWDTCRRGVVGYIQARCGGIHIIRNHAGAMWWDTCLFSLLLSTASCVISIFIIPIMNTSTPPHILLQLTVCVFITLRVSHCLYLTVPVSPSLYDTARTSKYLYHTVHISPRSYPPVTSLFNRSFCAFSFCSVLPPAASCSRRRFSAIICSISSHEGIEVSLPGLPAGSEAVRQSDSQTV